MSVLWYYFLQSFAQIYEAIKQIDQQPERFCSVALFLPFKLKHLKQVPITVSKVFFSGIWFKKPHDLY